MGKKDLAKTTIFQTKHLHFVLLFLGLQKLNPFASSANYYECYFA